MCSVHSLPICMRPQHPRKDPRKGTTEGKLLSDSFSYSQAFYGGYSDV